MLDSTAMIAPLNYSLAPRLLRRSRHSPDAASWLGTWKFFAPRARPPAFARVLRVKRASQLSWAAGFPALVGKNLCESVRRPEVRRRGVPRSAIRTDKPDIGNGCRPSEEPPAVLVVLVEWVA